ncbi:hypothetical protein SEA_THUMB_40 [Mycobacterium phage Thumb]|nr:hypothetical protein SEA_THUMB_40 [Mycobacterium phage Thumb]
MRASCRICARKNRARARIPRMRVVRASFARVFHARSMLRACVRRRTRATMIARGTMLRACVLCTHARSVDRARHPRFARAHIDART